jgi:hypothetical protein
VRSRGTVEDGQVRTIGVDERLGRPGVVVPEVGDLGQACPVRADRAEVRCLRRGLEGAHRRAPEYKVVAAALSGRSGRFAVAQNAVESMAMVVVTGGPTIALIAIAAGLLSELETSLYFTVVVLFLIQAAWTLLWLVFRERRPAAG